jgi:hypothetical protein
MHKFLIRSKISSGKVEERVRIICLLSSDGVFPHSPAYIQVRIPPQKIFHGSFACPLIAAIQQILRRRPAPIILGLERQYPEKGIFQKYVLL